MIESIINIISSGLFYGIICAFFAFIISPLQFIKIIRQTENINYFIVVKKYYKKGGMTTFFRGAIPYSIMNFWSSMAFGIAEYISMTIGVFSVSIISSVLIRSFIGGFIETTMSIFSEVQEISRNKSVNCSIKDEVFRLFIPILLRNTIFWNSSIIVYEITQRVYIGIINPIYYSFLLSLLIGPIFAFIALPFDVLVSRLCGSNFGMNIKYLDVFSGRNYQDFFSGLIIRIIQTILFTIITCLTMVLAQIFCYDIGSFVLDKFNSYVF